MRHVSSINLINPLNQSDAITERKEISMFVSCNPTLARKRRSSGFVMAIIAASLLFAPQSLSLTSPAQAAVLKNISEFAGQRCNPPPSGSGVIVGIFEGAGDSQFNFSDVPQTISRYRCFSSLEECKGWLYTMQSLYSANGPRAAKCLRR